MSWPEALIIIVAIIAVAAMFIATFFCLCNLT